MVWCVFLTRCLAHEREGRGEGAGRQSPAKNPDSMGVLGLRRERERVWPPPRSSHPPPTPHSPQPPVPVAPCRGPSSVFSSPNYTDLRPPNLELQARTALPERLNGKPPIEVLVPDTSRGGRAGRKFGLPTAGTWSAKMQNAQDGLAMTRRR
jgi:hypothetical protein